MYCRRKQNSGPGETGRERIAESREQSAVPANIALFSASQYETYHALMHLHQQTSKLLAHQ